MIKQAETGFTLPLFGRLLLNYRKQAGIYALLFIAISFNLSLFLPSIFHFPLNGHLLALVQVGCFLVLGVINTWLFTKVALGDAFYLPGSGMAYLCLLFVLIGGILATYYFFTSGPGLTLALASSAAFLVPSLVYQAWLEYREIPEKIFPAWYLPEGHADQPFATLAGMDQVQLQLLIQRRSADAALSMYPVTAPARMKLGRLFEHFIRQHLASGDAGDIEFAAGSNPAWQFKQRRWGGLISLPLNPAASLVDNGLRTGSVIIVRRVADADRSLVANHQ